MARAILGDFKKTLGFWPVLGSYLVLVVLKGQFAAFISAQKSLRFFSRWNLNHPSQAFQGKQVPLRVKP
jgi:hypothetical protein